MSKYEIVIQKFEEAWHKHQPYYVSKQYTVGEAFSNFLAVCYIRMKDDPDHLASSRGEDLMNQLEDMGISREDVIQALEIEYLARELVK